MEPVLGAAVDVRGVPHAGGLQRRLVGRPRRVDALVVLREVQQQFGFDPGHVLEWRRAPIERYRDDEVGQRHREAVRDRPAIAEADDAEAITNARLRTQVLRCCHEVLETLRLVQALEECPRLVFVPRVAAERVQRVGRERHEVFEREATRDVLDVRVEAAILVHDQHHRWRPAAGLGGPHEVATATPVPTRRVVLDVARVDAFVAWPDLLRLRVAGTQRAEHAGRSQSAEREPTDAREELPAIDVAVHVLVEHVQHLGIEVGCSQSPPCIAHALAP